MSFPTCITDLPAGRFVDEARTLVLQGPKNQLLFIEALADFRVPEHTHSQEWGVVLEGRIEMTIDGKVETHGPGDEHVIDAGVVHAFAFQKGTRSLHFFDEPDRVVVE